MATRKKPAQKTYKNKRLLVKLQRDEKTAIYAVGAILAGTAIFFATRGTEESTRTEGGSQAPPVPDYSKAQQVPVPKPVTAPPTYGPVAVPTTPAPYVGPFPAGSTSDTSKSHVFVDSWNGETVFGKMDKNAWIRPAQDAIVIVFNNRYLGKLTGNSYAYGLVTWVEVGSNIDGTVRKYWADKAGIKVMTEREHDVFLKGGGGQLISDSQLKAFRDYYNGK